MLLVYLSRLDCLISVLISAVCVFGKCNEHFSKMHALLIKCFHRFHCWQLSMYFLASIASIGNCEFFTSQSDLESLVYIRKEVITSIERYVRKEEERLIYLKERLKASKGLSPRKSAENIDENGDTGNPINAFLLVKALTLDLSEVITIAGDRENFREFAKAIEDLNEEITFPGGEDMSGAALGLIRLQDTYQLHTKDIANGAIGDSCCAPPLSVEDCFELGRTSYHEKEYDYAIDWLTEALTRIPVPESMIANDNGTSSDTNDSFDSTESSSSSVYSVDPNRLPSSIQTGKVSKTEILDYLYWAQNIKKTIEAGKDFLSHMTGIELDEFIEEVEKVMDGKKQNATQKMLADHYKSLCRGEKSSTLAQNPRLNCKYSSRDNNPYYIIGPVKEELVNLNPPIWSFKEVINEQEIEEIKQLARHKLETAMIVNVVTGTNERSDTRISKSAWLSDYDGSIVARVNQRIGRITGLTMDTAELLQIANYGIGGMYLPHYDFAQDGQSANFMINDGNRIATMLFYISDVAKGGATVFPKLNLTIWPEKGSAVFWYNLQKNGKGDLRTQHAACPVLVGSKWVSNKWIHERGQEFRYKCGLGQDE